MDPSTSKGKDEWTDRELVGYCDLHARTPLALFHIKHLRRLLELAGRDISQLPTEGFFAFHYYDNREVFRAAWDAITKSESSTA